MVLKKRLGFILNLGNFSQNYFLTSRLILLTPDQNFEAKKKSKSQNFEIKSNIKTGEKQNKFPTNSWNPWRRKSIAMNFSLL